MSSSIANENDSSLTNISIHSIPWSLSLEKLSLLRDWQDGLHEPQRLFTTLTRAYKSVRPHPAEYSPHFPTTFLKAHINNIPPPMPRSFKLTFFYTSTPKSSTSFPLACYMSCSSHPYWSVHPGSTWRAVQLMEFLIMQFFISPDFIPHAL
jgi:hypothetical protein